LFSSLIFLLSLIYHSTSFAIEVKEVEYFSKTSQWNRILYFNGAKSLVLGERYFLAKDGSINPASELKATLNAFHQQLKNSEGEYFQCLFPARYKILKQKWPSYFKDLPCKELNEWIRGIDVQDTYLVFTSAYPDNPASMFGHTFLRFGRKSRGKIATTKELLGYSVAFQARTNPDDNPMSYTFKGLFGGYQSYPEIKPQYINIGVYNNGESRDLWEIKLNLSEEEKELLLYHLWELSISSAFNYYFFDENCSTQLVRLLEIIKPDMDFASKDELFVVPQVTYREIASKIGTDEISFRPSLKRKINSQYHSLNNSHQKDVIKIIEGQKSISAFDNVEVIDTVIDFWKFTNYKMNAKLDKRSKDLMYASLLRRSEISSTSNQSIVQIPESENPADGFPLSLISLGGGADVWQVRYRYGFHDFYDSELGFDQHSYIKFMDINFSNEKGEDLLILDVIDILSLRSYSSLFTGLSWRGKLTYFNHDKRSGAELTAGTGLSWGSEKLQFYTLGTMNSYRFNERSETQLGLNPGFKIKFSPTLSLMIESQLYAQRFTASTINKLVHYQKKTTYSLEYAHSELQNDVKFSIAYYW